jgi:hypothetical protein
LNGGYQELENWWNQHLWLILVLILKTGTQDERNLYRKRTESKWFNFRWIGEKFEGERGVWNPDFRMMYHLPHVDALFSFHFFKHFQIFKTKQGDEDWWWDETDNAIDIPWWWALVCAFSLLLFNGLEHVFHNPVDFFNILFDGLGLEGNLSNVE